MRNIEKKEESKSRAHRGSIGKIASEDETGANSLLFAILFGNHVL